MVQIEGGPKIAAPADQLVIPGNTGYIPGYDPYPDHRGSGGDEKATSLRAVVFMTTAFCGRGTEGW